MKHLRGLFVPRYLSIDWDQNQLHVVAGLAGGGKVKFQRAVHWQEEKSPNPAEAEALGRLLRERLNEAGIAAAPVLACVGRDRVILKDLRFPAVPIAEEAGVVRFQAVKELTDSPDDVVIDYVTAGAPARVRTAGPGADRPPRNPEHLPEDLPRRRSQAGGADAAAVRRRGQPPQGDGRRRAAEDADAADAVVVIGDRWAEFAVLRGQTPLLSRTMAVGPGLAGEVRRNLTVYAGQAGRPPVRAVYVAGAGAELRQRLNDVLEVPLHEFDPVRRGRRPRRAGRRTRRLRRGRGPALRPRRSPRPAHQLRPAPPAQAAGQPQQPPVRVRRRHRGRRLGRRRLLLLGRLRPGRQPACESSRTSATGWNSSSRRSARRASCTRRWTTGITSIGSTNCTT